MSDVELTRMIDSLISGDISEEDHTRLQEILKANADAREIYRQRIDLEASLRTWAQQQSDAGIERGSMDQATGSRFDRLTSRPMIAAFAVAAMILLVLTVRLW